jgi:hypothetical protein
VVKAKKPKKPKGPKPECVTVSSEVRKLFSFIDEEAKAVKEDAVRKKRNSLRKKGRKLTDRRLKAISDALERIQRLMNPLQNRRKKLVDVLLAHYGHERITEIIGKLGNTLLTESFVLAIENPDRVISDEKLTKAQRDLITKTALVVEAAFAAAKAEGGEELQKLLLSSIKVKRFTVSVTPPSSRTPNTGEQKEDPESDDA